MEAESTTHTDHQDHDDQQASPSGALATVDYISGLLTASRFDLDQLLQEVVRTTTLHMNLKAGAVRLIDAETGELVIHAVHGLSDEFLSLSPRFDVQSRFHRLIANGGVLQVEDLNSEPDLDFTEAAGKAGIASLLAVGLYGDDELIGALSVYTRKRHAFTVGEVDSLHAIANQVSLAIKLARLYEVEAEKERLEHELSLAAEIQKRVLPAEAPQIPGFKFACRYTPWEETGGDFYDFIELPAGNLGIAVGDVSGKGIWAALLSFEVRTALRAHAEHEYAIGEVIAHVNQSLYRDTEAEQFATLSYGVLNQTSRLFTYVTALCPPPILVRDGAITELDTGGLAVGVLPDQEYDQALLQLEPGDLLVMYSDGYSEIFNEADEMFGDERVQDCILATALANPDQDPDVVIEKLEAEIEGFLQGSDHGDDRTIVVLAVER